MKVLRHLEIKDTATSYNFGPIAHFCANRHRTLDKPHQPARINPSSLLIRRLQLGEIL
jgi:hypothetical protein